MRNLFSINNFLWPALCSAILAVDAISSYRVTQGYMEANRAVSATHDVLADLEGTLSELKDAETGLRGYLLTGEERFLDPYQEASGHVKNHLQRLTQLTRASGLQRQQLDALEVAVSKKLEFMQETLGMRKSRGFDAARRNILLGTGPSEMNKIRSLISEMQYQQRQALADHLKSMEVTKRLTRYVFEGNSLIALAFMTLTAVMIVRRGAARRRAEEILRESEQRFRLLVDGIRDYAIYMLDTSGRIVTLNAGVEALKGHRPEDIVGQSIEIFYPEEERQKGKPGQLLDIAKEKGRVEDEGWRVRKDGSNFWGHAVITALYNTAGQIRGYAKVTRDLTERKWIDELLRESEERFRSAFAHEAIGMALCSTDGRWIQVNEALCKMVGYSKRELLAADFQLITHPDDLDADLKNVQRMLSGAIRYYQMEKRYLHKDGHIIWVLLSASLVRNSEGRPLYFTCHIQDITQRKLAENALLESHHFNEQIVSIANDAIVVYDRELRFQSWNRSAERMTGLTKEDVLGKTFMEVFPHLSERGQLLQRALHGEVIHAPDYQYSLSQTGKTGWASVAYGPYRNAGGEIIGVIALGRDITEQKTMEAALKDSDLRLREALEDRQRLSQDLHDHIIQSIYAIGLGLEESQRLIEEGESNKAIGKMEASIAGLNGVIADVRGYISGLEEGLVTGRQLRAMLARLVHTMESPQAIRFRLDVDPKAVNCLTPEEATHLLYIAQEAMSNSLRHSGGRSGQVTIRAHEGTVRLEISDDGVGFDPDRHARPGHGLQNMAARARKLGARVNIASKRGQGTWIVLEIPKEKERLVL